MPRLYLRLPGSGKSERRRLLLLHKDMVQWQPVIFIVILVAVAVAAAVFLLKRKPKKRIKILPRQISVARIAIRHCPVCRRSLEKDQDVARCTDDPAHVI